MKICLVLRFLKLIDLNMKSLMICDYCNGLGIIEISDIQKTCDYCNGKGKI
jgi:DnaJ-class molecular chaperone